MPETGDQGLSIEAEIFSVGEWNGEHFTGKDLAEIVRNFQHLKGAVKPPLKFGHDENQTLLGQRDGDPSLGWVQELWVQGDRLLAKFAGVPAVVYEAIRKGRYRRVSAELYFNVRRKGKKLGKVLKAVALLGADLPAVTNLKDLGAYFAASTGAENDPLWREMPFRVFTLPVQDQRILTRVEEISPMNEEDTQQDIQAELAELRTYKERQEQYRTSERDRRKKEAFRSMRKSALDFCEEQVHAGRLSPFLRELIVKEIDAQAQHYSEGGPLRISFDGFRKFILESGTVLPREEVAFSRGRSAAVGQEENPSETLSRMATDKMTELGISYGEASEYILRTHPELALAYREFTLNPQT